MPVTAVGFRRQGAGTDGDARYVGEFSKALRTGSWRRSRRSETISERDYIIVTNNRRDVLRLYAEFDVHNGLIIIVPVVARAEQRRMFGLALDAAERQDSLINLLIEVHADGSVEVQEWSKDKPLP